MPGFKETLKKLNQEVEDTFSLENKMELDIIIREEITIKIKEIEIDLLSY